MESLSTKAQLEDMVDAFSLRGVLRMLTEVCAEKAEHLQTNWQDSERAKDWDAMSKKLDRVAADAYDLTI